MALCEKCGAEVADGIKMCATCGAETKTEAVADKFVGINNTADTTADFDASDIASNKLFAVLSYFGLLFLVPLFAAPNSKFAKFHANQGIILCIVTVAWTIVSMILGFVLALIFPIQRYTWSYTADRGVIYTIVSVILNLIWIIPAVLVVLGIYNAATGKAKELPIIGKFKILK
jgi:Protein of unknown function (DUF1113).